jgi:hypothetical protein
MIADTRAMVYKLFEGLAWPTYLYFPEDATLLPCVVLGRPTIDQSEDYQPSDFTTRLPVYVLGRRMADDDAQSELDEIADEVIERVIPYHQFDVIPAVETIAGQSYPAYTVTVIVALRLC